MQNTSYVQRAFVFILSFGIAFTALANPSLPILDSEHTDYLQHHVKVVVRDVSRGVEIYINNELHSFDGRVQLVSFPDETKSSDFRYVGNEAMHLIGENGAADNTVLIVGGHLVIVYDGKIKSIPFPDTLMLSRGARLELVTPPEQTPGMEVSYLRVVDNSMDLIRTLAITGDEVFETSEFNVDEAIHSHRFVKKLLQGSINGLEVRYYPITADIPSARSKGYIDLNPRIDRILSHGSLKPTIKTGILEAPISLSSFIQNTFKIIRKVELRPESKESLVADLDRGLVGLTMRQGGGVRITGRPGTGKTFLSEMLIAHIYESEGLVGLKNSVFIHLDQASMVAGTGLVGEFENKLMAIRQLSKVTTVVLVIDEMHTFIGAGAHSKNPIDFFQYLKPDLEAGKIKIIGTTTEAEWSKYFSGDRALSERFPVAIQVKEPNKATTLKIMRNFLNRAYPKSQAAFMDSTLETLYNYSSQFDAIGANPRKALRILDYMAARFETLNASRISDSELLVGASEFYSFDISKLTPDSLRLSLSSLGSYLDKNLAGLEEAKSEMKGVLADHFLHQIAGNAKAPTAVLLYGDRGAGKTVFATQIAKGLNFDFKRLMMASYGRISGAEEFKTELAMAIRGNPFVVILLDEIEKASPDIQQVLLQILDEGKFEANLTERSSTVTMTEIDASKVIFIGATNAAKELAMQKNVSSEDFEVRAEADGLNRYVLDRFTAFLPMRSPESDVLKNILKLKLSNTLEKFRASGYQLDLDETAVIDFLVSQVMTESQGAGSAKGPLGFGRDANAPEAVRTMSVRRLEREIKDLERKLSDYFLKNPQITKISVRSSTNGLSISGGDGCETGFLSSKKS